MAESPIPPSNPLAARLAERYGMTVENADELLSKTKSEYSASALPPTEEKPATPIEQAAATLSNAPVTQAVNSKPFGGGFLAAIFVVLLIGLGVALSFQKGCFRQRMERQAAKPVDTIQSLLNQQAKQASTPPVQPSQTPPNEVPPEALAVPQESPAGTTGKPAPAVSSSFSTSSNFEAEERLAELHAQGYTKAHMKAVKRHGSIIYIVSAK